MIVEDEAITAEAINSSLESMAYEVTSIVNTGEAAIEGAEQDHPDVILMDIRLKGQMDGIEAAERIRSRLEIPIIFLTAHADEEKLERAKLALPFGYVLKPFQDRDLKIAIEMALYAAKVDAERKQAEDSLRASEERYAKAEQIGHFGHYDRNLLEKKGTWSNETYRIFGVNPDQFQPTWENFLNFVHPSDREFLKSEVETAVSQYKAFDYEYRIVRPDGSERLIHSIAEVDFNESGQATGLVGTVHDITEQRQAEDALRESEEKYRSLTESSHTGIFIQQDGRYVFFNDQFAKIHGFTREEILNIERFSLIHPEDREKIEILMSKRLKGEPASRQYEMRRLRKDGKVIWCEIIANKIQYKGKPAIMGNIIDISERKNAEKALRESEEKHRDLYDNAPNAYFSISAVDGSISRCNNTSTRLFGYDRETMLGMKVFDLYADTQFGLSKAKETFKRFKEGELIRDVELQMKHKDGHPVWISLSVESVEDHDGNIIESRSMAIDISERKRLEAQLQQAQKMEAIGTLAGGIAHDFNNILGAIIGCTELSLLDVPQGFPARPHLIEVLKAGNRAKDLVKQILAFSRQSEQEQKPMQPGIIVNEALKMLRPSLPSTIQISQYIKKTGVINADPTRIHQILMNLCTNAAHAMREKGGILKVNLSNVDFDAEAVEPYPDLTPGSYINLTVSDTGHGMNKEVMERMFDPYFTTKETGEGTGLGLAVIHGIVRGYGGAIKVDSEPGKGSTFQVFLPRIDHIETQAQVEEPAKLPTGNERILFVDDEETLVYVGQGMLERLGYEVITRTSSVEALEAFRAQPDKFDLVITDMTMPNKTGTELAKELLQIRPDIPILLCTGFSEKIDGHKTNAMGIGAFVMKPIVMSEIANIIRQILDKT